MCKRSADSDYMHPRSNTTAFMPEGESSINRHCCGEILSTEAIVA
ncbi:MAG: hypothetical protein R6U91_08665 [Bacillota bacterium]